MCKILFIKTKNKNVLTNVLRDFIKKTTDKELQGRHFLGYGLAWDFSKTNNKWEIYKSTEPYNKDVVKFMEMTEKPQYSVLAFIRREIIPNTRPRILEHVHPFCYENIVFTHNGYLFNNNMKMDSGIITDEIYDILLLNISDKYKNEFKPVSVPKIRVSKQETDSRTMFFLFMTMLDMIKQQSNNIKPTDYIERAFLEMIKKLQELKISMLLNIVISDGDRVLMCNYNEVFKNDEINTEFVHFSTPMYYSYIPKTDLFISNEMFEPSVKIEQCYVMFDI